MRTYALIIALLAAATAAGCSSATAGGAAPPPPAAAPTPAFAATGPTTGPATAPAIPPAPPRDAPHANPVDGFRITVPAGWQVVPGQPVQTVLAHPEARLEIFVQDVSKVPGGAEEYVRFGNRSVLNQWNGIKLVQHEKTRVQLAQQTVDAWRLEWYRPVLSRVPGDRNQYVEYNLVLAPDRVATLLLKSTAIGLPAARAALAQVVASWQSEAPAAAPRWHPDRTPGRRLAALQRGRGLEWSLPEKGILFGAYDIRLHPKKWQLDAFKAWEQENFGAPMGTLMTYQRFPDPFPTAAMESAARDGRLMYLSLQAWYPIPKEQVENTPTSFTLQVLNGQWDSYLRQWARDAAAWGKPFLLRWGNEMNSDWAPWGAFQVGKDSELYRLEWQYVHRIFQEEGATNAVWVWNPNGWSHPQWQWNHQSLYWPGGAHVDMVGLTAYNMAGCVGAEWITFRDFFKPIYDEYRQLYPGKPLVIPELASHTGPGNKAKWLQDMLDVLEREMPEVKMVLWWNGTDRGCDFRLDQPEGVRQAVRTALTGNPYVLSPGR